MENLISKLRELKAQIDELMTRIDVAGKARLADELESTASESAFWNDPEAAQKTMRQLSRLKAAVDKWQSVSQRISDAIELAEIADDDMLADMEQETGRALGFGRDHGSASHAFRRLR